MGKFDTVRDIGAYVALIFGAVMVLASRLKTENLKDLKERVEILEREREESRTQHVENQKAIAHLEGQLSTYKEIPLKSIAGSLEQLTISNKNVEDLTSKVLDTLQGSAKIALDASHDGGLLVQSKKTNPIDVKPVEV